MVYMCVDDNVFQPSLQIQGAVYIFMSLSMCVFMHQRTYFTFYSYTEDPPVGHLCWADMGFWN